uniref:Carboxylesterase type B domain-containing protein n=1 Tax=Plectus sambesii TaxID=2011161 RepID=A0A914VXD3_9BILA
MAGSASASWALVDSKFHSKALATQLKCPTNSSETMMECLRAVTNEKIHEAVLAVGPGAPDLTLVKFSPVIDGEFLPFDVGRLRKEAPRKRVIAGAAEREGGFMTIKFGPEDSKYHSGPNFSVADFKNFLAELLPESSYQNFELLRTLAAHEYLRNGDPGNHTLLVEEHMKALGDHVLNVPLYKDVQSMVESDWTVFLYSFDYSNPAASVENDPIKKAYHIMEIPYLFEVFPLGSFKFNRQDERVLRIFTRRLTNFAKYGDPNGRKNAMWKAVTKDNKDHYLSISTHPTFQPGFHRSAANFWMTLVPDIERLGRYHIKQPN